jgi:hypothetical protein
MKEITKKILSIASPILLFSGCASNGEPVAISDIHTYNENFGVVDDPDIDAKLQEEILAQAKPVEVEIPKSDDPNITTELKDDPDAFTAEEFVPEPPIITYKYMDDPKFYTANELPENKWRR